MTSEYVTAENVYRDRDAQGAVRVLSHFDAPFVPTVPTPQSAAAEYLRRYAGLLEVPEAALAHLERPPERELTDDPVEFRFATEKSQDSTSTVAYEQTVLGLPIWEAGLTVQMGTRPPRVLSSHSNVHQGVEVANTPDAPTLARARRIDEGQLARALGLTGSDEQGAVPESPTVQRRELVVFQFHQDSVQLGDPSSAEAPGLPLPAVPSEIVDGRHYVCVKVDFALPMPGVGLVNWVAMVEVTSLAVVFLRPFIDHVTGLVFRTETVTDDGGPPAYGSDEELNRRRVAEELRGLTPPVNGTQELQGDNIKLSDRYYPVSPPPTRPTGMDFDFEARTDNFAAVNAYHHCDKFFRLAAEMECAKAAGYFGDTPFPVPVDHRANVGDRSGSSINAFCVGTAGAQGLASVGFCLANLTDDAPPLGIACDYRVVLHELAGHGVLYGNVHCGQLGFSHSAGDSVAVILSDPDTRAADRYETFPWIPEVGRRHDRSRLAGWGYSDNIGLHPKDPVLDFDGYNNEQILSTTMFRIYRAVGGDEAKDLYWRRGAARNIVYLILKAIGTLTPGAGNPTTCEQFVDALQVADTAGKHVTGSLYRKVIRWAFEKQGAYQAPGTPTPNKLPGAPPAVDVYIDDGRHGEYTHKYPYWGTTAIWNRRQADGGTDNQEPVAEQTNYAYVKIKNRGRDVATNVVVKGYHDESNVGQPFPSGWHAMTPASLSAPDVPGNDAEEIVVGPFEWVPVPPQDGLPPKACLVMTVSATEDACNADTLPPGEDIHISGLIPFDNNTAMRNIAVAASSDPTTLAEALTGQSFKLMNPKDTTSRMELRAQLPEVLSSRGWRLEFDSGPEFTLQPRQERAIRLRLVRGAEFTADDVRSAADRAIHVTGHGDGMPLGGISYQLDPGESP